MREAIAAVETQLRTSVLRGRRWENLDQQDQMLTKVKPAEKKRKTVMLKTDPGTIRVGDVEATSAKMRAGGGGAEQ